MRSARAQRRTPLEAHAFVEGGSCTIVATSGRTRSYEVATCCYGHHVHTAIRSGLVKIASENSDVGYQILACANKLERRLGYTEAV